MSEPTQRSEHRLAAALRAQAGLTAGSPGAGQRHPVPAWVVLAAAVLLGTVAGVLAGLVSLL